MKAVFFSDVHLKEPGARRTQHMVKFLRETASKFDRIYILGDFFDAWPATSRFLVDHYQEVLGTLKQIIDSGKDVYYLEGNHDFHFGNYFKDELGMKTAKEEFVQEWGGKKVFLTHGDRGNPKEKGYLLLRTFLRSGLVRLGLKFFPGKFIYDAGLWASGASRDNQFKDHSSRDPRTRDVYREYAVRKFKEGFDIVMFGHTHIPDDYKVTIDGRECRYLNTGDWVGSFTYVEFDGQDFYTKRHPMTD